MSKETKLAKKEAKATKKAAKEYNKQTKEYNKLVKKIDKKNAKLEKKASKKGKPFTPIATPTFEEAFAGGGSTGSKAGKIIKMIILIVLLIFVIYFIVMFVKYQAPALTGGNEEETTGEPATYERYKNKHVSTTTPDYPVYEAQKLLKQVIHDNWKTIGFSSDVSGGSINFRLYMFMKTVHISQSLSITQTTCLTNLRMYLITLALCRGYFFLFICLFAKNKNHL